LKAPIMNRNDVCDGAVSGADLGALAQLSDRSPAEGRKNGSIRRQPLALALRPAT
jgi:hypothetical protein